MTSSYMHSSTMQKQHVHLQKERRGCKASSYVVWEVSWAVLVFLAFWCLINLVSEILWVLQDLDSEMLWNLMDLVSGAGRDLGS